MNKIIDLHTHTNFSDGACTPKELIDEAIKEKVKAIALTDHDAIEGLEQTAILAKTNNINFLPGIEISSLYKNDRIIHILGLGININNEEFLFHYNEIKQAREHGVEHILLKIKQQGISIDIEELRKKALGKYLDRYDVYRYFVENKFCNTSQEIWDKYLDPIPYGEKELIKVEDAIKIIKASGGLSFLAHYNKSIGFAGLTNNEIEKEVNYLINLGLDGVERYYPSFNKEDCKFLDYLIKKYDLIISGGTDYHGNNRPEIKLGSGKNYNLLIPYDVYIKIENNLSKNIKLKTTV